MTNTGRGDGEKLHEAALLFILCLLYCMNFLFVYVYLYLKCWQQVLFRQVDCGKSHELAYSTQTLTPFIASLYYRSWKSYFFKYTYISQTLLQLEVHM